MRQAVLQSAIAAAGVMLVTFGSLAASNVIGVVASQGRYPEAMLEYALPALGGAAQQWATPVAVFSLVVFGGLVVLARVARRTASTVLGSIAVSVVAAVVVALALGAQIAAGVDIVESKRMLALVTMAAVASSGTVFLTGAPMVVIGALLLRAWRARRGLTEGPDSL